MINIAEIKQQVIIECEDKNDGTTPCNKEFFTLVREGNEMVIKDCSCRQKLDRRIKCFVAGIDELFWNFEWDDIEDDFDKKILSELQYFKDNIDECVVNKTQFLFDGNNGAGKTIIASLMLKDVLLKGYTGYLLKAGNLLKYIYSKKEEDMETLDKISDADFLVIDEVDKLNGREKAINDVCDKIDTFMFDKALILISNDSIKKLKINQYPQYFIDRLDCTKNITFKGTSYRGKMGNKYDNLKGE